MSLVRDVRWKVTSFRSNYLCWRGEDTVTPSRVSNTLSSRCVVLGQVCQKNSKRNWFKPVNIRITLLGNLMIKLRSSPKFVSSTSSLHTVYEGVGSDTR